MIDQNALRSWMDFYDQQGLGGNIRRARDISGGNPFDVNAMKADWAMKMLGGNGDGGTSARMPEYFGGQSNGMEPQPYVPPQRFVEQQPPTQGFQQSPMVQNYLAMLLRGRR